MGYIRHHAIVATGYDFQELEAIRQKCIAIMDEEFKHEEYSKDASKSLISPILSAVTNGYESFFIAPDGSKEGWGTSEACDRSREKIVLLLTDERIAFAEISFGDEAGPASIINES